MYIRFYTLPNKNRALSLQIDKLPPHNISVYLTYNIMDRFCRAKSIGKFIAYRIPYNHFKHLLPSPYLIVPINKTNAIDVTVNY